MKMYLMLMFLSIFHVCLSQTKQDSIKIRQLLVQSQNAILNDINSTRPIIDKGIQFCRKKEYRVAEAKFCNMLGNYFFYTSQIDSAEYQFRAIIQILKGYENGKLEAACFNNLGLIKKHRNQMDSACIYFKRSQLIDEENGNFKGAAESLVNISTIYRSESNHPKSIEALQQSLELVNQYEFDSLGNIRAAVMNNLGSNFFAINDYEKALKYYRKAARLFSVCKDLRGLVLCVDNIIVLLELKGELAEIEHLLGEMDESANKIGHPDLLIISKNARANYAARCGDYETARLIALNGLELAEKCNDQSRVYSLNYTVGRSLFKLGFPDKSIEYLLRAIEGGRKVGKSRYVVNFLHDLAESYHVLGEGELAYERMKEAVDLQDSLIPLNKQKTMQSLEIEYQTKLLKKDNQIKEQNLQQSKSENKVEKLKTSRFRWIASIIGVLAIAMLLFALRLIRNNSQLKKQKNQIAEQNELIAEYQRKYSEAMNRTTQMQLLGGEKRRKELIELNEIIYMERGDTKKTEYKFLRFPIKENEHVGKNSFMVYSTSAKKYAKLGSAAELLRTELKDSGLVLADSNLIVNLFYVSKNEFGYELTIREWDDVDNKMTDEKHLLQLSEKEEIKSEFIRKFNDFQKNPSLFSLD